MIDLAKLEGLATAIEEESKVPSPSHLNLARLLGMFCRELIFTLNNPVFVSPTRESFTVTSGTVGPPASNLKWPEPVEEPQPVEEPVKKVKNARRSKRLK